MIIKRWMVIVGLIAILMLSVLCGFFISNAIKFSKKQEENLSVLAENEQNQTSINTNYSEVIVSPNCKVISTQKFKKCGHVITKTDDAPRDIINLNEEKVQEYFKGWNIDRFSSDKIEISQENSGICNEHYIIGELDGYISISVKNDIGESIFKGLTDISTQYLPEDDLKNLEYGIEIVGRDNLNKFLEDFE